VLNDQESPNSKNANLIIDMDEFDINFTAINKGLGFDQNKNTETKPTLTKNNTNIDHPLNAINTKENSTTLAPEGEIDLNINKHKSNPKEMGDLSAFYKNNNNYNDDFNNESSTKEHNSKIESEFSLTRENEEQETPKKENNYYTRRLFAWTTDLILISTLFMLTIFLFFILSPINNMIDPYNFLSQNFLLSSFDYLLLLAFYSVFFLCYFTFLDQGSLNTFGKYLFRIKLKNLDNNKNPNILNTFTRSFIIFLSLFSLGLINIFNFQDRISNTVIKSKYD
jgi:hypothetical protein